MARTRKTLTKEYVRHGYATVKAIEGSTLYFDQIPAATATGDLLMMPTPDSELRIGSIVEFGSFKERKKSIVPSDTSR